MPAYRAARGESAITLTSKPNRVREYKAHTSAATPIPIRNPSGSTTLDPTGLQGAAFGYTGIVVAALARYNPFAVCLVAALLGGLQNAGFTLQGVDFPSGLVGVMQGVILFCALGGELLIRYRVRIVRAARSQVEAAG